MYQCGEHFWKIRFYIMISYFFEAQRINWSNLHHKLKKIDPHFFPMVLKENILCKMTAVTKILDMGGEIFPIPFRLKNLFKNYYTYSSINIVCCVSKYLDVFLDDTMYWKNPQFFLTGNLLWWLHQISIAARKRKRNGGNPNIWTPSWKIWWRLYLHIVPHEKRRERLLGKLWTNLLV